MDPNKPRPSDLAVPLANNALKKSVVQLSADMTLAQAYTVLAQERTSYGYVVDAENNEPVLVSDLALRSAQDQSEQVGSLLGRLARVGPVSGALQLGTAALSLSDVLAGRGDLAGVLIEDEKGEVIGVIPCDVLIKVLDSYRMRGGDTSRLGSEPLHSAGRWFFCPEDGRERWVAVYRRNNPPRCECGRPMQPKPS